MKYLVFSDLHGSYTALEKIEEKFLSHQCDKFICLGDLLYHGPRNNLPEGYNPKLVVELLQKYLNKFIWIHGNCDAEVDMMVMKKRFYKQKKLHIKSKNIILTHGHHLSRFDTNNNLKDDSIVLYGHYHVFDISIIDKVTYINIGSTSIPKDQHKQYGILDDNSIKIYNLDNDELIGDYQL